MVLSDRNSLVDFIDSLHLDYNSFLCTILSKILDFCVCFLRIKKEKVVYTSYVHKISSLSQ